MNVMPVERESVNPENHHHCRPFCPCCGGGDLRKGYKNSKATSHYQSVKARRDKRKTLRSHRTGR